MPPFRKTVKSFLGFSGQLGSLGSITTRLRLAQGTLCPGSQTPNLTLHLMLPIDEPLSVHRSDYGVAGGYLGVA